MDIISIQTHTFLLHRPTPCRWKTRASMYFSLPGRKDSSLRCWSQQTQRYTAHTHCRTACTPYWKCLVRLWEILQDFTRHSKNYVANNTGKDLAYILTRIFTRPSHLSLRLARSWKDAIDKILTRSWQDACQILTRFELDHTILIVLISANFSWLWVCAM